MFARKEILDVSHSYKLSCSITLKQNSKTGTDSALSRRLQVTERLLKMELLPQINNALRTRKTSARCPLKSLVPRINADEVVQ